MYTSTLSDVVVNDVPDITTLPLSITENGGSDYILDLSTLKTEEDIVRVLRHFSTRVFLHVFETSGIERYVKPVTPTKQYN